MSDDRTPAAPAPYERQPNESPPAFRAFATYRDLGPDRTLDLAWQRVQVAEGRPPGKVSRAAPGRWTRWSTEHNWVARAAAYDAHLDSLRRQTAERVAIEEHRHHIEAYQSRQRKLAEITLNGALDLLAKSNERLATLKAEDINPQMLPSFFRAAAAVAEQATNAEAQALAVHELLAQLMQE